MALIGKVGPWEMRVEDCFLTAGFDEFLEFVRVARIVTVELPITEAVFEAEVVDRQ